LGGDFFFQRVDADTRDPRFERGGRGLCKREEAAGRYESKSEDSWVLYEMAHEGHLIAQR
jgi:hypothetical protein